MTAHLLSDPTICTFADEQMEIAIDNELAAHARDVSEAKRLARELDEVLARMEERGGGGFRWHEPGANRAYTTPLDDLRSFVGSIAHGSTDDDDAVAETVREER